MGNSTKSNDGGQATALDVVAPPYGAVNDGRTSTSGRLASAAVASAKAATAAAKVAGDTAMAAAQSAGKAVGKAAQATAGVVGNAAAIATQASADVGERAATAAGSALNIVGDLNGDGRFDSEDVRIAMAAVGRAAAEVGGEAAELGKGVLRHPAVKDAAAGAIVGGVIGSAVPIVGTHLGAVVGAAAVVVRGGSSSASTTAGKGASGITDLATKAVKSARKRKTVKRVKPKA